MRRVPATAIVTAILVCAFALRGSGQGVSDLAADLEKDWSAQKDRIVALAEAMPAEKYEVKATPPQRTYGEQLMHLAEANVRLLKALDPAGAVPVPTLPQGHAKADVVQAVTAAYDYGAAVLNAERANLLNKPASAGRFSTRARAVWAAMSNAMDHYGQCVVYLRLNGIVPPASRTQ